MQDHNLLGILPNPQKDHIVIILAKNSYAPVAKLWKAYFCPVFAVKISQNLIIIVKIGKILGILELKYLKIDRKWQYCAF